MDSHTTANYAILIVTPDVDGDGVDDAVENAGPNGGDGNGDGTPDGELGDVTTLPAANGNGYLTLESSCTLLDVSVTTETEVGDDPRFRFPFGMIAFGAPCPSATFTLFAHGTGRAWKYRKYASNPPGSGTSSWCLLPDATVAHVSVGGGPACGSTSPSPTASLATTRPSTA